MRCKNIAAILALLLGMVVTLLGCADTYEQPYYGGESVSRSTKSKAIKDLLDRDKNFTFVTSKTVPGEETKAYIYSTEMSVPEAARYLKEKRKPYETSDMNSLDKIILTYDSEYAVIYQAEDKEGKKKTLVQASTRQYVYRSRSFGLYNPYRTVVIPYPVYYEKTLLNRDRERYGNYSPPKRSVRSGSTGSSFNRGGGTGFGK